jgi:hypothetical protein
MKRLSAIAICIVAVAFFISSGAKAQVPLPAQQGLSVPATLGKLDIEPVAFGRLPWTVWPREVTLQARSGRRLTSMVARCGKAKGNT